jgi:ligand-binding sensor domain-containing protein
MTLNGPITVLAVWLFISLSSVATAAVPEARLNPVRERLPVIDGKGIRFTRITTAEGLSQTRVSQIVQDDRGFIWFGTQYGLDRYDGYKFKVFLNDPQRPNSIGGTYIYALFKDRSGMVWIGCDQSLDKFDPVTEEFTHYPIRSGDPQGLSSPVVHISQDRGGMLWLATGTGLSRLNPGTGQIKIYRHKPGDALGLNSNNVEWTGEDRTGTFWVGTNLGLDAFDRETGRVALHVPLKDEVKVSFLKTVLACSGFFPQRAAVCLFSIAIAIY